MGLDALFVNLGKGRLARFDSRFDSKLRWLSRTCNDLAAWPYLKCGDGSVSELGYGD